MMNVDECRGELHSALSKTVSDEATQKVLCETIQAIDEKAGHHTIEMVWIDEIEAEEIDAQHVWFKVTGAIAPTSGRVMAPPSITRFHLSAECPQQRRIPRSSKRS